MARQDPLRNFRFRLEVDGLGGAEFSKVTMGNLSKAPIEYWEGEEVPAVPKLSSLTKYASITLKWGITESVELADWHQQIVGGVTLLEDPRDIDPTCTPDDSRRGLRV